ncbi:Uncharacterized membrane protein [Granulicella pectinivorans]|jgi:uncharacterized membrane protein|uniref:Uncharacterized membrane protein n=1 Tax=Granulicella pectinivorans TaxID=474950 RepID=A0A1I6LI41_9BACT|nr:DUF4126 family protein [Granulicella pectinivorans]SFS03043.1 Uncharacterized membrane protein [Granulicella pectinivorans]
MAVTVMTWLFAFPLLGFATGMRTMTPIAVLCWFAYFKYLPLQGTWGSWAAMLVSACIFTVFAFGEWIGDKLPQTPNRTDAFPLIARLTFGGLVGALAATGVRGPAIEGLILGVLGAAIGTFVGFMLRRSFAQHCGRDLPVAIIEDGIALLFAALSLHMITS